MTSSGDTVLGRNGQPVKLGADGNVDPRTLDVVALTNPEKVGDTYVTGTPGAARPGRRQRPRRRARGLRRRPDPPMVDMMASLRAYEAGQKVIHTIDETLGKAASLRRIR